MQICYLLAFPDTESEPGHPGEIIKGLKDAPYFQPVDINVSVIEQKPLYVENVTISVVRQLLDHRVQMLECHFALENPLHPDGLQQCQRIKKNLQNTCLPPKYLQNGLYEEFIILQLREVTGTPDEYLRNNAQDLARFIRSQREIFSEDEIADILSSQVYYAENELTVVDWEGAVIISPVNDFHSDIELLKIGNYQLLRYRMIDQAIEESLREISAQFKAKKQGWFRPGPTRASLRRAVSLRLELMLDFEHISQNLLLIGDWYTAKLYHAIQNEFYLNNWKQAVQEKLDNLEKITETIQENFSLSWRGLMEQAELVGWIILLIGYFILFFMEANP